jgi:hypothetical protein
VRPSYGPVAAASSAAVTVCGPSLSRSSIGLQDERR